MQEPKFKVGDKVKHPEYNLVFTILEQLPNGRKGFLIADYKVSYPHDLGTGINYFNESELTLYKEEEMTQKFKIGDRVQGPGYNTIYTIINYDASRDLYLLQDGIEEHFNNGANLTLYVEERLAPPFKIGDYVLVRNYGVRKFLVFAYNGSNKQPYVVQLDDDKTYGLNCNEKDLYPYPVQTPEPETTIDECKELFKRYCLERVKGAAYLGEWTKEFQLPHEKALMIKAYLEENGFTVKSEPSVIETTYTKLTVSW